MLYPVSPCRASDVLKFGWLIVASARAHSPALLTLFVNTTFGQLLQPWWRIQDEWLRS
jgi:hypothetical protein